MRWRRLAGLEEGVGGLSGLGGRGDNDAVCARPAAPTQRSNTYMQARSKCCMLTACHVSLLCCCKINECNTKQLMCLKLLRSFPDNSV